MPSPFPGMDPFLEDPEVFPDLHDMFIVHITEDLMARLPEPYHARVGSRNWLEPVHRRIGPDVRVHRGNGGSARLSARGNGGTAVLTKPVVVTAFHDEARETFVEVYSGQGKKRRLVTSLEVLSPTNKTPGEHGRNLYRQKQRELCNAKVNLVEIDLLRGGEHTTAVPLEHLTAQVGKSDYHVCCWRFERFNEYFVYPFYLSEPLPTVAIPLLPGDGDVALPLQPLFERVYDAGPFPRVVDYRGDVPPPPLSAAQSKWIKKQLAARSLRKRK